MTRCVFRVRLFVVGVSFLAVACGGGGHAPTAAPPSAPPVAPITPNAPSPSTPPNLSLLNCGGRSARGDVQFRRNVAFPFQNIGGIADLYAPKEGSLSAACPVIVVLPPGCSVRSDVTWVGPLLAAQGYVVMIASAEIVGGDNVPICAAMASAALDFLASTANPFRASTDTSRAGGVGYSQAGRVLVLLQNQDRRVKAIVAWDNLPKSDLPDQGSPSCARDPGVRIAPRAPALGLASEICNVAALGIDAKKTGFDSWRASGMPAMEIVFAGADHGAFAGGGSSTAPFIGRYTQLWFDRWLKGDTTATARLLATSIDPEQDGTPVDRMTLLSAVWRSAAFLDGFDCADLRTSCP